MFLGHLPVGCLQGCPVWICLLAPFPKWTFLIQAIWALPPFCPPPSPPGSVPHYDAPGYLSPSPNAPLRTGHHLTAPPGGVFLSDTAKVNIESHDICPVVLGNKCLFCLHNLWVPNMFSILKAMSKCIHFNFGRILKLKNAYWFIATKGFIL